MPDERENILCEEILLLKGKNKKEKRFTCGVQNKALGRPLKLEGRLVVFFIIIMGIASSAEKSLDDKWRRNERKSKENMWNGKIVDEDEKEKNNHQVWVKVLKRKKKNVYVSVKLLLTT